MGIIATCDVTVTLTTPLGTASVTVTVPEENGLIDVNVTLLGIPVVLANVPCPTIEPITLTIGGLATVVVSASPNMQMGQ